MAAITTVAGLATIASTRSETFDFHKIVSNTNPIGAWTSTWMSGGSGGGPTAPTTAVVPTKSSLGSVANFTNPGGGELAYLYSVGAAVFTKAGPLYWYDRLVHSGGLSGTSTSLQTINTPAITRGDTNGVGTSAFVEVYANLGTTGQNLTVTYTNTAGTGSRTTVVAIPGTTARAGRIIPIPVGTGDLGFKSIESVQLAGSTGTVGNFGVTIARRICVIPITVTVTPMTLTGLEIQLPKLENDCCLWLVGYVAATNGPGTVIGALTIMTTG